MSAMVYVVDYGILLPTLVMCLVAAVLAAMAAVRSRTPAAEAISTSGPAH